MEKKKRGRPLKVNAKRRKISIRISEEDAIKLEYLMRDKEMTLPDIFKNGLKMVYNLAKYK